MAIVVLIVVIGTTIWVGYDARQNRIPTDSKPYSLNNGALAWVFTCILLWIAAFPYYLVKRSKVLKESTAPHTDPSVSPPGNNFAELERLADLRDKGILTEQEFQTQKAKLLGVPVTSPPSPPPSPSTVEKHSTRRPSAAPLDDTRTVECPRCGQAIPLSGLKVGINSCPHCQETFEAE